MLRAPGRWARALRTPEGPATVQITWDDDSLRAEGWGEGASWALRRLDTLLGLHDNLADFEPGPLLAPLAKKKPPAHRGGGLPIVDVMQQVVLGQRVTTIEATESWVRLCGLASEDAPGPLSLRLPPNPRVVARLPDAQLRQCGIDWQRARTLREICFKHKRLQTVDEMTVPEAVAFLQRVPGVGPWTATATISRCTGDPDLVILGDLHIPLNVVYALTGERNGTDEQMMALLAPWTGHRARVVGLIKGSGTKPPRRQPKPELFKGW